MAVLMAEGGTIAKQSSNSHTYGVPALPGTCLRVSPRVLCKTPEVGVLPVY